MFDLSEFTLEELVDHRNRLRDRIHEIENSELSREDIEQGGLDIVDCTKLLLLVIPQIKLSYQRRVQYLTEMAELSQDAGEHEEKRQ